MFCMPRRENKGKKKGKKETYLDFKPMTSSLNYSTLCPLSHRDLLLLTVAPDVMFYTDVQISATRSYKVNLCPPPAYVLEKSHIERVATVISKCGTITLGIKLIFVQLLADQSQWLNCQSL